MQPHYGPLILVLVWIVLSSADIFWSWVALLPQLYYPRPQGDACVGRGGSCDTATYHAGKDLASLKGMKLKEARSSGIAGVAVGNW